MVTPLLCGVFTNACMAALWGLLQLQIRRFNWSSRGCAIREMNQDKDWPRVSIFVQWRNWPRIGV